MRNLQSSVTSLLKAGVATELLLVACKKKRKKKS
jgi:hypothetical protein